MKYSQFLSLFNNFLINYLGACYIYSTQYKHLCLPNTYIYEIEPILSKPVSYKL